MKKRAILPLLCGGLFLILIWRVVAMLSVVYRLNADFSHGFLIPILVGYMAWNEREKWFLLKNQSSVLGYGLLIMGALLVILGLWYDISVAIGQLIPAFICGTGVVFCIAGFVAITKGIAGLNLFSFPILYLFFAVPIPELLANRVVIPLKMLVTKLSVIWLHIVRIPVEQHGNVLHLSNAVLGVADACSGIRSLWVLMAMAAMLGYISKCNKLKILLLCGISVPVAILGNFIRIAGTAMLIAWINPEYAEGSVHEMVGLFAFAISMGILFLASKLANFENFESEKTDKETPADKKSANNPNYNTTKPAAAVATILLLVVILLQIVINHYHMETATIKRIPLAKLARTISGYNLISARNISEAERVQLQPSDDRIMVYAKDGSEAIDLSLMFWEPARTRMCRGVAHPHSPDVCMPSQGWKKVEQFCEDIKVKGIDNEIVSIRFYTQGNQKRAMVFWRKIGNIPLKDPSGNFITRRIKALLKSWNAPVVAMGHQYYVSISMNVKDDFPKSRATLLEFARDLATILPKHAMIRELNNGEIKSSNK